MSRTAPAQAFHATCLDFHNVPTLPAIPPREIEADWAHVKDLLVSLIEDKRTADESMCYLRHGRWRLSKSRVIGWRQPHQPPKNLLRRQVLTLLMYDEEMRHWRMRSEPLVAHRNPLLELNWASAVIPWLRLLARKVLAVTATSAAPDCNFSVAGNVMSKKRASLTCDHLEELIYLHEVWPKVREWQAIKKARLVKTSTICVFVEHFKK